MPTSTAPPADAATAREAAQHLLAHPISLRLSAHSIDLLLDLAHRDLRIPVAPDEAASLTRAILTVMEAERLYGSEVRRP